jgi:hypothetical protein
MGDARAYDYICARRAFHRGRHGAGSLKLSRV